MLPEFVGIDDILPQHIATGTDRSYGREIDIGYPDSQPRVLLEHPLTRANFFADGISDETPYDKLKDGGEKGQTSNGRQERATGMAADNIPNCDTRGDGQRDAPAKETQIGRVHKPFI